MGLDPRSQWWSPGQILRTTRSKVAIKLESRIMDSEIFVAYVGDPDFHDGHVLRVSAEATTAEIVVEGYSGKKYSVFFEGVDEVQMNAPEGMELYSLSEMLASPPLREFVFTNNEEDHPGILRVIAKSFRVQSS